MALYTSTDQFGQPLNTVYAEDVAQLVNVLTGLADGGALSLLPPVTDPTAFTPTVTLQAGALTGAYKWAFYWITGVKDGTNTAHVTGRTLMSTATATQNPSSQQATVSISGVTVPTGVIGWGVCRTKAGGSTYYLVPGSEQFTSIAGTMPATWVDNVADGTLVTTVQTQNTTGTSIAGKTLPTGAYLDFAGVSVPSGWPLLLLCDGSAISRTKYWQLFAQIGTTFGVGDGSTTFNLPDYRGRVMVYIGTNASVSSLNINDGQSVANRRPQHRTTSSLGLNDPQHTHSTTNTIAPANTNAGGTQVASSNFNPGQSPVINAASTGITLTGSIGTNNANDALDTPSFIVGGIRLIQA